MAIKVYVEVVDIKEVGEKLSSKILEIKEAQGIGTVELLNERLRFVSKNELVTADWISSLRSEIKYGKTEVSLGFKKKLIELSPSRKLKDELESLIGSYNERFIEINSTDIINNSLRDIIESIIENSIIDKGPKRNQQVTGFSKELLLQNYKVFDDSNYIYPLVSIVLVLYKIYLAKTKTPLELESVEDFVDVLTNRKPSLMNTFFAMSSNQNEISLSRDDAKAISKIIHSNIDLSSFIIQSSYGFTWAKPENKFQVQVSLSFAHSLSVNFI